MPGKLYLVSTPIGNLEDITYRAVRVLQEADLIAAEDTRNSLKLLNHLGIKKPMLSYYEHNKLSREPEILSALEKGKDVAVISDAGTPGLSDPGADIARAAIDAGIEVIAIPGASALLSALVTSGLDTARFVFEGFLPRNKSSRRKALQALEKEARTMVFYEAPHRMLAFLQDAQEIWGSRQISVSRELSKIFEETVRGNIEEIREYFSAHPPRGEFTIVVSGTVAEAKPVPDEKKLKNEMEQLVSLGFSRKEAAKQVAVKYGLSVREIYGLGLKQKNTCTNKNK